MKIAHIHVWDKNNKGDFAIVQAVQQIIGENLTDSKISDFPMTVLRDGKKTDIEKINVADLVIIGGGGIYYRWFLPYSTEFIKKIKPPIVIFGVGYIREIGSRKLNKKEIESIAVLNKKAALSSVRDYYTKNFLIKAGVPIKKISVIGDPAIFLLEKKPKKITFNNKIKIGLNLNYSGWLGFGYFEKDILKSYEETASYFQNEFDAEIYYMYHHPDEKKICQKLKIDKIKPINLPPTQQKYVYGKMDLIIGMMLHSVVLSFGAKTPEINVAYDIRNKSFAKFIGCPELVISSKKLKNQTLLKRAKIVFKNRQNYKIKFERRKEKIWKKHLLFLDEIKKIK